MRDLIVLTIVFAGTPVAVFSPYLGVLLWTWLSVMNPHKLAWGIARDFPVAQIAAVATLIGILIGKDERRFPFTAVTFTLFMLIGWMCVTSVFAIHPDLIGEPFSKVMKIQFMILVALLLVHTRQQIHGLLYVLAASLAFFGVKGGIYTLFTGTGYQVYGPPGGFFYDNNALALAQIMTIPLLFYLYQETARKWLRYGLLGSMALCAAAALGSHSRGGLLAIAAMGFLLWLKSQHKLLTLVPIVLIGTLLVAAMPEHWGERMSSIANYEEDRSAMGRINAWWMAYNLARDRFLGGGFEVITPELFARYAPVPGEVRAAHSIYFQMLGEHGFVGLGLFLLLWLLVWRSASWTARQARGREDLRWAARLSNMIKVSLVGYFVGGAFLSLAYFDLPYNLLVLVVATQVWVRERVAAATTPAPTVLQPAR
jgi:probable O-glycosylation ligase (exosortase A-associated)